jgi:hypothetical protein
MIEKHSNSSLGVVNSIAFKGIPLGLGAHDLELVLLLPSRLSRQLLL